MNDKKWHDHLTAVGTVIALILGGVTFYYQFLKKSRELSAVVLPITWDGSPTVTVRVAIWNDGTRDEEVEVGELVISGTKLTKTKRLFGPEVIKPGEAKTFSVNAEVGDLKSYTGRELLPSVENGPRLAVPVKGYEVNLEIVLKTMDRAGGVIVSRLWGGCAIQGTKEGHGGWPCAVAHERHARLGFVYECLVTPPLLRVIPIPKGDVKAKVKRLLPVFDNGFYLGLTERIEVYNRTPAH